MRALILCCCGMFGLLSAGVKAPAADEKEDAKIARARTTISTLERAAQAYFVKNQKFPEELDELVRGTAPLVLGGEKTLLDPWGKKYEYDRTGKRHEGARPDIWTKTPDGTVIGNWKKDKS